jgi:FlaG/FlaF family flagellin (archaellin)
MVSRKLEQRNGTGIMGHFSATLLISVLLLAIAECAVGDTLTWNGGSSGDWDTTTANWTGSSTTWTNGADIARFDTPNVITATLGEAITADGIIVVNGGNDVTIDGNFTLTLDGDASTDIDSVTGTGQGQTLRIATDLVIQGGQNWVMANRSGLTHVSGDITGTSAIDVGSGNRTYRFTGENSGWSGGLFNPSGTHVQIGSDTALGTGDIALQNDAITLESYGGAYTVGNDFTTTTSAGDKIYTITGSNDIEFSGTWSLNQGNPNTRRLRVSGSGDATFSGLISGGNNGASDLLVKDGSGRLILSSSGSWTNTRALDVQAGTLLVNGSMGSSTHAVNVTNGASLGGTGSIAREVSVSGTLAPGASVGTLEITDDANLNDGSTFQIELDGTSPGDGAGFYDQLLVSGDADISGTVTLDLILVSGFTPQADDVFYILTQGGSEALAAFDGYAEGYEFNLGDAPAQITYLANWTGSQAGSSITGGNDIAIMVIPEPASLTLLAVAGLAVLRRRRG